MRRLVALFALPVVLALVPSPAGAGPGPGAERRGPTVTLEGHGYGHGRGMSQYGAQGAALQGLGHRQILDFYYPGTRWGRAGGTVAVLLTADTSPDVGVSARTGLTAKSVGRGRAYQLAKAKPAARKWRITAAPGGRSKLAWKGRSGGWRTFQVLPGDAQFSAGGRPVTLHRKGGAVAYRGVLRSVSDDTASRGRDTVNRLPLDSYLKGVVPQEVPATWHQEAVRAQAVAARTYVAFERAAAGSRHYDICDTTACHVYGGHSAEHPASNAAVTATRGRVLTHGGAPAFTQYSASNGGWTVAGAQPYLVAQQDPYDGSGPNPYRPWRGHTITAAQLEAAYPGNSSFTGLTITQRDGRGEYGGRVLQVRLDWRSGDGTPRSTTVSGDAFRSVFGLRSELFTVTGVA